MERGCQSYTTGSRCERHQAQYDARRRADPTLTGARGTSAAWKKARAKALELAGYRCAKCGATGSARRPLEVHHVDGRSANNAQANLTPLCPDCHRPETRRQMADLRQLSRDRIASRKPRP